MDKLFATHNEKTWKEGLRKNTYEPCYVSSGNHAFDDRKSCDFKSEMTAGSIKIDKYDMNETLIGGLYNKLAEKTTQKL
jgi:hypothetical protein